MPVIVLSTTIHAPIQLCFDLSRSIDLHKISTSKTNEEAVEGKLSGCINLNETVTWQATHFGIRQQLTSKITALQSPDYFIDEQVKGIFKSFQHKHIFQKKDNRVIMIDIFEFQSPFGMLGRLFNFFVLTNYLKKLLLIRNKIIKEYAESERWKALMS